MPTQRRQHARQRMVAGVSRKRDLLICDFSSPHQLDEHRALLAKLVPLFRRHVRPNHVLRIDDTIEFGFRYIAEFSARRSSERGHCPLRNARSSRLCRSRRRTKAPSPASRRSTLAILKLDLDRRSKRDDAIDGGAQGSHASLGGHKETQSLGRASWQSNPQRAEAPPVPLRG
jgi:hypothetical protein